MTPTQDPIAAVSQRLEEFVVTRRHEAAEMGDEAALLVDEGAAALRGGKRLRARFCIAGWRAVAEAPGPGERVPDDVIAAAAALEAFHAAALVHDDLIDNSDTRRGHPSAHRAIQARHREAGWTGDAAAFGRAGAILLGDLLVAWSDDILEEGLATTRADAAAAARRQYAVMRRDVTVGQFLDVAEESAFRTEPDDRHAERALRVASLKSARYSVQQPLLIGASLAGADDDQLHALERFGHPVGMAFQLRDDLLGVFGDAAVTGKPSGDDLREGKRTVLVAYAREAMTPAERAAVDGLLGDPELDDAQISTLQAAIRDTGAPRRVERLIADLAVRGDSALDDARLGAAAVAGLRELARAATVRSA